MGEHKLERTKSHGWQSLGRLPLPNMETSPMVYGKSQCRVLVDQEDRWGNGVKLWHLSISCPDRYPTWDEIKDARYSLLPMGLTFAMLLPPMNEYVNVHPNCFHLWEINDNP